jgi:outer membrane immunogenic protein
MAALGAGCAATVAPAADLPTKTPAPAVPYNWTGCYIGGTLGWDAADRWNTQDINGFNAGGVNPWPYSLNTNWMAGGTVGCNWQPSRIGLVVGIEGEGGFFRISGGVGQPAAVGAATTFGVTDNVSTSDGYGLVAGRVGWAFWDTILLYGKVGAAFYDERSHIFVGSPINAVVASGSAAQTSLAFGGGVEYAFDRHWSGKAEFMWIDAGKDYLDCGALGCWREEPSAIYIFKLGLNYKF